MSDTPFVIESPKEKPSFREILSALPEALRFIVSIDRFFAYGSLFVLFLHVPLGVGSVLAIKHLTDAVTRLDGARAWQWLAIMAVVSGVSMLVGVARGMMNDTLRYKVQIGMTQRWLEHINALPYHVLEDARFQSLAQAFERKSFMFWNVAMSLLWILSGFFECLGLLAVLVYLPWQAVLIFLIAQIVRLILMQRAQKWSWDVIDAETREGKRVNYYQSTLTRLPTIEDAKAFGFAGAFLDRWKEASSALLAARLRLTRGNAVTTIAGDGIQFAGLMIGLVLVLISVLSGEREVSVMVVFMTTLFRFQSAIANLAWNVQWFSTESVILPIFKAFFAIPREVEKGKALPKGPLTISFEDVWFRYPGTDQDILRGISLTFTQGDHLALVGLNGAGKSTLLKLLMGMYEPTRGDIRVNGVPLRTIKPSVWRSALAVLSQTVHRYDDSLEEQILYGDIQKAKNRARLQMATRVSDLDEVMSELPKGLRTHIGKQYAMETDNPIELSGGQNQLLAIARTLYRDARVYIFDEPTSAVDAEKEEHFFSSLPEALQSRALLFVSHRFSTLRRAKRILVMDQGRIIEDGTHEELLAKEGRYAELFALQAKMYQ